jgi:CheY-like chemotaxis protein
MKQAEASARKSSENKKTIVMVVDDEPVVRETILEILQDEGFEALGMSNAAQALLWVERIRPNILLSDNCYAGNEWDRHGRSSCAHLAPVQDHTFYGTRERPLAVGKSSSAGA